MRGFDRPMLPSVISSEESAVLYACRRSPEVISYSNTCRSEVDTTRVVSDANFISTACARARLIARSVCTVLVFSDSSS